MGDVAGVVVRTVRPTLGGSCVAFPAGESKDRAAESK